MRRGRFSRSSAFPDIDVAPEPWLIGFPSPPCQKQRLLLASLKFLRARFRHAAHAFAGVDARNRTLAGIVILAVGVPILHPESLRDPQFVGLRRRHGVLERLLICFVE